MPISHVIDHDRQYMETIATGPIGWADLASHWEAEVAEGGESYPELVDGSQATVQFTPEHVRLLVERLRITAKRGPLGPTAVVVSSEFAFGMLRMLGILVEPFCEIMPFRNRADAEAWLLAPREPVRTSGSDRR